MAVPTQKELWNAWMAVWNGKLSIADEIIAPTFVAHFAPAATSPAEVRGPEGLKQMIGGRAAALSDYTLSTPVVPRRHENLGAGAVVFRRTYQMCIPGASPA